MVVGLALMVVGSAVMLRLGGEGSLSAIESKG